MSSVESRLELGKPAPNFTLPSVTGDRVTRSAYRSRRHLVVVFFPTLDQQARAYLATLRDRYAEIRAADGEVLAVFGTPDAAELAVTIDLPFPLLLDPEAKAARRYLSESAPFGVFVLDRYAALRAQWFTPGPGLPSAQEIVDWVVAIDRICVL